MIEIFEKLLDERNNLYFFSVFPTRIHVFGTGRWRGAPFAYINTRSVQRPFYYSLSDDFRGWTSERLVNG